MIRLVIKDYNFDINSESAKNSALLGKIDKYEYLAGEGTTIWSSFTYSPLDKALEKQKQLKIKEKNK